MTLSGAHNLNHTVTSYPSIFTISTTQQVLGDSDQANGIMIAHSEKV